MYEEFFNKIDIFLDEVQEKKIRGVNDYNLLSIVRNKNEEVGLHSKFIYSLLNHHENHNQGELFLKLFIKYVLKIEDFGEVISVKREDLTSQNRRIDFTIESTNYYIGIEMKIDASDLKNQISDYEKELKERVQKEESSKRVKIYYLTRYGKQAPKMSSNGILYTPISFKKEILDWINKCLDEVSNITNLSVLLSQYRDIIEQITKQYRSKLMSLREFLKNSSDDNSFEIIETLTKEFWMKRAKIKQEFFSNVLVYSLKEKLASSDWIIEVQGDLLKKYDGRLEIYKKDWKIKFIIRFEKNDMNSCYWGIQKTDNAIDLDVVRDKFRNLKSIKNRTNRSLQWDYFRDSRGNIIYKELDNHLAQIEFRPQEIVNCFFDTFQNIEDNFEKNGSSFEDINSFVEKEFYQLTSLTT